MKPDPAAQLVVRARDGFESVYQEPDGRERLGKKLLVIRRCLERAGHSVSIPIRDRERRLRPDSVRKGRRIDLDDPDRTVFLVRQVEIVQPEPRVHRQ